MGYLGPFFVMFFLLQLALYIKLNNLDQYQKQLVTSIQKYYGILDLYINSKYSINGKEIAFSQNLHWEVA